MKSNVLLFWLLLTFLSVSFTSCLKDECQNKEVFYQYDPVYVSKDEIKNGYKVGASRTLKSAGKIYVYGDYLLINEPYEGIHIVNNSNPSSPQFISFITIPGNLDLAVINNILYADNYTDLLAINISNPASPVLHCRVEDVFMPILKDPLRGYLVRYKKTEFRRIISCEDRNFGRGWFAEGDVLFKNNSNGSGGSAPGLGGSTARFTIYGDYLYTVDISQLYVFDIKKQCPLLLNKVQIGWNIETIYPYNDFLYIGSTSGMFMYGLKNPALPNLISSVSHWSSCDPVVAEGNTAYVTLHGGTACNGYTNQLDIIDISNIYTPVIIKSYDMFSPRGLAISEDFLYVCDDGLKIYNVTDKLNMKLLKHEKLSLVNDIILYPDRKHCILTGEEGIRQYSIENNSKLRLLSNIPVQ
ncbi:MAG: hypothetical protein HOP11_00735 [Saprospiraceae bacterium]|nr:hypothetical protein [Saprospiraceae bacterium]